MVKSRFKNAGFTQVKVEKIEDLITGWLKKDGAVKSVAIGGDDEFSQGDKFRKDIDVVIRYHTFMSDQKVGGEDGSPILQSHRLLMPINQPRARYRKLTRMRRRKPRAIIGAPVMMVISSLRLITLIWLRHWEKVIPDRQLFDHSRRSIKIEWWILMALWRHGCSMASTRRGLTYSSTPVIMMPIVHTDRIFELSVLVQRVSKIGTAILICQDYSL